MAIELVERSAKMFAERAKHFNGFPRIHTQFGAKHFDNERIRSQRVHRIPWGNGVCLAKVHLPSGWSANRVKL